MEKKKIDKIIEAFRHYRQLKEDGGGMVVGPTNNVGGGKIAGTPQADPGNPPVFRKKRKKDEEETKKYIYPKGLRKWWKQNLR